LNAKVPEEMAVNSDEKTDKYLNLSVDYYTMAWCGFLNENNNV